MLWIVFLQDLWVYTLTEVENTGNSKWWVFKINGNALDFIWDFSCFVMYIVHHTTRFDNMQEKSQN